MFRTFTITVSALLACPALAQEGKATAESLEACQAVSGNFSEIAKCVPDMDPALAALGAFSEIYGSEALPLKSRCLELNSDQIGAFVCVNEAVKEAVKLGQMLPEDAKMDDPVFNGVSSPEGLKRLNDAHEAAKSKYPKNSGNNFVLFHHYR